MEVCLKAWPASLLATLFFRLKLLAREMLGDL
jgi:hypothetical protein